ncbi:MAG: (d)CMP kinase [Acutalibacteraceae bacterium]
MINIAIDGPAGAGKSTIAKAVAAKLGIIYLDTGAMYRAVAYAALKKGIDVKDPEGVAQLLENLEMDIRYENGIQNVYVNGENATPYLRTPEMSKAASDISALPVVRYKMVELQREFAAKYDVVLDGRDIGTFVLPAANCKFYMTASPEERAKRRFEELTAKGETCDYNAVLQDIVKRDYNDSHREVAPLKQADDAYYLDTTELSIAEVTERVEKIVKERVK